MQSIIQDGSDEMPPIVFEGAIPYKRSINEKKGFFAVYDVYSYGHTGDKCMGDHEE